MHELESPSDLAGFRAQRYDGIGPLVVSGTQPAVVVGTRTPGGNKNQISRGVDGHDGPGIAGTAAEDLCILLWRCGRLVWRNRVPAPAEGAGACVISAHDAARHVDAVIVVDGGAHDDEVVDDRGRRSHVVPAGVIARYIAQTHLASFAKVRTGRAVHGIEGHQSRILR